MQYASDLHLEFRENRNFLGKEPLQPVGEALVLAGDIVPFQIMSQHEDFFNYISDHFEITWWIPGNHEYYYSDISERNGAFQESIRSNIHLVNNTTIIHHGVRLIFSSLWSHIHIQHRWKISQSVNDFKLIRFHGSAMTVEHFNKLHQDALTFITTELERMHAGGTIVVTHHVPTLYHYPDQYRGDELNDAFAVELFDLIESSHANYWIYGHHHCQVPEFWVGSTRMSTNQLGYVRENEHLEFDRQKVISI